MIERDDERQKYTAISNVGNQPLRAGRLLREGVVTKGVVGRSRKTLDLAVIPSFCFGDMVPRDEKVLIMRSLSASKGYSLKHEWKEYEVLRAVPVSGIQVFCRLVCWDS